MHVPCQVTLDLRYSMSGSPSLPVGFEGEETSPKEASPKEASPQSKSPFGTPRWGVLGLGHMDMAVSFGPVLLRDGSFALLTYQNVILNGRSYAHLKGIPLFGVGSPPTIHLPSYQTWQWKLPIFAS